MRIWKRIEVVITGLTRNQVVRKGSWVRIPPLPPKKHRNLDTMGIKVAVLFLPEYAYFKDIRAFEVSVVT